MALRMAGNTRSRRVTVIAVSAVAALVLLLISRAALRGSGGSESRTNAREEVPAAALPLALGAPLGVTEPSGQDAGAGFAPLPMADAEILSNPYPMDLERLRARLPNNLYWELGAPTADPAVLQRRAEEERRRNELFGKVQSGTATEEEINRYYDHRRRLSEDYLAFSTLMLAEYGAQLTERDRGLYELSIQMHRARLQDLPRQHEESLARKRVQDQRREEWLRSGRQP